MPQSKEEIKQKKKEWYEKHKEEIKQKKKEYYQTNKEKFKQKSKEYHESHKEEKKQKSKEYHETHKEEISQKKKEYNQNHKEEKREYCKEYYQNHKEEKREYAKEYNETHKEEIKEYHEKRKEETPLQVKLINMINSSKSSDLNKNRYDETNHITLEFLQEQHIKQQNKCGYCQIEMEFTFDNNKNPNQITIERLNNDIGHIKSNCIFACFKCNRYTRDNDLECVI